MKLRNKYLRTIVTCEYCLQNCTSCCLGAQGSGSMTVISGSYWDALTLSCNICWSLRMIAQHNKAAPVSKQTSNSISSLSRRCTSKQIQPNMLQSKELQIAAIIAWQKQPEAAAWNCHRASRRPLRIWLCGMYQLYGQIWPMYGCIDRRLYVR